MKKGIILLAVIMAATAVVTGCGAKNNATVATTAPVATADTASKGELTEAEAKAAALKDANIPESEATFVKAVKKTEDGFTYFEIEFTTATKKYTYKILTTNGTIKDRKVESYSGDAASSTGAKITEAEATAAALAIAELNESDVSGLKATLTTENGVAVYKVVFTSDGEEFEYLINASNGELYEAETESDSDSGNDNDSDSDEGNDDSDDGDSDEDSDDSDADSDSDDGDNDSDDNNNND